MARRRVRLEQFGEPRRSFVGECAFWKVIYLRPTLSRVESQGFWLGGSSLEVQTAVANGTRTDLYCVHESDRNTVTTQVGSDPEAFHLSEFERGVTNTSYSDATGQVPINSSDEKSATRRRQLVVVHVHVVVDRVVPTIELVGCGEENAQRTTGLDRFGRDGERKHRSTLRAGPDIKPKYDGTTH